MKRPRGPFQFFFRSRAATGDFGQMSVLELSTRVGEEWNGMTDGEKEVSPRSYRDLVFIQKR